MRSRPWSHALLGALLLLGATAAHATTVVVAPDGSGDFTSIQAALDDLFAHRPLGDPLVPPDTAIVMAGTYDETIQTHVDGNLTVLQVVCPAGPQATRVRSVAFPAVQLASGHAAGVLGLGVIETAQAGTSKGLWWFDGCRFEAGYTMDSVVQAPSFLANSTFLGPTRLSVPAGVTGLHFIGAPAVISGTPGAAAALSHCTFEGPADTLVVAQPREGQLLMFAFCTFRSAAVGLTKGPVSEDWGFADIAIEQCTFEDLTAAAVGADWTNSGDPRGRGLTMQHSRVVNCGRALVWRGPAGLVSFADDTLQTTLAPSIVVESGNATFARLVSAPGCGGIEANVTPYWIFGSYQPGTLTIGECAFTGTPGRAIDVVDPIPYSLSRAAITQITVANAGEDAIHVATHGTVGVTRCVITGCAGDAVDMTALGAAADYTVESNTFVRNLGNGLRFSRDGVGPSPPRRVVRKNMAVENDGVGLQVGAGLPGSVAANNAWLNATADFADVPAPLDSNLSVHPQFCNLPAGDYHLKNKSACGTRGPYGLIGAMTEACAVTADVPVEVAPLAFSIAPNPARGAVLFTPPATGADGAFEVLDLQGRRLWSAPARAGGAPILWRGTTATGAVHAGLYWVRFTRPGEAAARRLVWTK